MSHHTTISSEHRPVGVSQSERSSLSQHNDEPDALQNNSTSDSNSTSRLAREKKEPIVRVIPGHSFPDVPKSAPNLTLGESLGTSGLTTIIGGAIVIFASVAFLSFLWFAAGSTPEAQKAPAAWRYIALSGWTTQAITLIALVLRAIVTAQAGVCVSMLAGLILERSFVPRSKVAHFSIIRATDTGPTTLMHLILSSQNIRTIFKIESLLGLLLLLNTTGLQFSSTILLSDIYGAVVTGDKAAVEVHSFYSANQQKITRNEHFYKTLQPIFAVYGELPSNTTTVPSVNGLSDTGIIERAFLPIGESQERMAVRSFEGEATAFSLRTTCMRPDIRDFKFAVYEWKDTGEDSNEGETFGQLNATLDYGLSTQKTGANDACGSKDCPAIPFSCYLSGTFDGYGWQSTFCFIGGVGGTLWPPEEGPGSKSLDNPWSVNSSMYLVFSNNMRTEDWVTADSLGSLYNYSLIASTASDYEEWKSYQLMPGGFLNVSLCFQSYSLGLASVRMTATGAIMEPNITRDLDTGGTNTDAIQTYFGTDPTRPEPDQRGILQIETIQHQPLSNQDENRNITLRKVGEMIYEELVMDPYSNLTLLACYHCTCGSVVQFHIDLTTVLANTINSTRRAADIIQTNVFSIAMTVYYKSLETFTVRENATISSIRSVMTAQGCKSRGGCSGFVAVVTLLAVHITIVLVTTTLYTMRTRFSKHSNVWCAVSQLASDELCDVMETSGGLSDKIVVEGMEREGKDYGVKIGNLPGSRGVGVLRHWQNQRKSMTE